MNLSQTLHNQRAAMIAAAPRHRAHNLRAFGSVARGTAQSASDIDLLVDTLPGATLFDLGALQVELEELRGALVGWIVCGRLFGGSQDAADGHPESHWYRRNGTQDRPR